MNFKFGDIIVGKSYGYSYTCKDTHWMVVFAFDIPTFGGTRQRIRVVGTTHADNRDLDFFKEYTAALLGNHDKWVSRFSKETYYDMVEEMKQWIRQYDKYLEYDFLTFEVDPNHFDMAKPFFTSNKDGALTLKNLGD